MEVEPPEVALATITSVAPNHPNPFNATTAISYTLAEAGDVKLTIYNLGGQLIEALAEGHQEVGEYRVIWEASDYSSGIYFYRLTVGDFAETRRMVVVK